MANVLRESAVEFAEGSGYLVEAQMEELRIFQYVYVPEDGQYIRLLATGEHRLLADVMSAVDAIVASVVVQD